jgi:selenide,water dikinase
VFFKAKNRRSTTYFPWHTNNLGDTFSSKGTMQTSPSPVLRDLVLIGGGHSHVGVLRMFAMKPEPGVRLTLISTDVDTPYSGMLPGYVAGHYSFRDVHIDLARLCAFAGARFYHSAAIGIDRVNREVLCANRPPVPYDLLSINTGATPNLQALADDHRLAIPVKPITQFNQRWLDLLARVKQLPRQRGQLTIAVVGGGAGGVELILAMQHRLRQVLRDGGDNPERLTFTLLTSGNTIMPTHNTRVQAHFTKLLARRNITVHLGATVSALSPGCLHTADGRTYDADETMWVTQAAGAGWLKQTGLALDDAGFIRVNAQLQSVTDPTIYAAGDITSFAERPLEKAGVFAVRMTKPLATNLRRALQGKRATTYRPQRRWLALISTGDRFAVASRGELSFAGEWVWRWKDYIDRRFMKRFNDLPPMRMAGIPTSSSRGAQLALNAEESMAAIEATTMRCGGCGAKVGATVLSRALTNLAPVDNPDVLVGLHAPDDAAVVRVPAGKALVHTVDFFRAFIDDPYLFGRIAANHALGDIFAMGATPHTATAIATIPPGLDAKTETLLSDLMTGAVAVLNEAGCTLVGGHTGEGAELGLGFAINGLIDTESELNEQTAEGQPLNRVMQKAGMMPGEQLIITKAIGTGTLLAAHAQAKAVGVDIGQALVSMQQSNQRAAAILQSHGASACTDVTGFGLLGHLLEMTKASGVGAQLDIGQIPLLAGAERCIEQGVFSSLQTANARSRHAIANPEAYANTPRYALLFDPQTAGGLLASVPADRFADCLSNLKAAGYADCAVIGEVLSASDALTSITLTA